MVQVLQMQRKVKCEQRFYLGCSHLAIPRLLKQTEATQTPLLLKEISINLETAAEIFGGEAALPLTP